jgi:predicted Zn-dependent protease
MLPLELLLQVAKYLSAKDYLRMRICSSATMRLSPIVSVSFEEYKTMTEKNTTALKLSHVLSLRSEDINRQSLVYLAELQHDFEFIRILDSRHGDKISKDVFHEIIHVASDAHTSAMKFGFEGSSNNMLPILRS